MCSKWCYLSRTGFLAEAWYLPVCVFHSLVYHGVQNREIILAFCLLGWFWRWQCVTDDETLLCPFFLPGYSVFQLNVGGPKNIWRNQARLERLGFSSCRIGGRELSFVFVTTGSCVLGGWRFWVFPCNECWVAPTPLVVLGFSWDFCWPLTFCHTSPLGIVLDVKWPCRRENELTVFNCSSSSFSHANVQPSALYLKSNGLMQYSWGLEEWWTAFLVFV